MITVTPEEIAQYQSVLTGNPEAQAALEVIKECDGNLEDAATVIALEIGEEEVQADLLDTLSGQCHSVICQEDRKEELPVLVAALKEFLAADSGFPTVLATPVAIFVTKIGLQKFCQSG
jgi:hypothetical protein